MRARGDRVRWAVAVGAVLFALVAAGDAAAQSAPPAPPASAKPAAAAPRALAPLAVIVARDSPLTELSLASLRALFQAEGVKDPSGRKLLPINHPAGSPERVSFDGQVLRMTADEVGRFWVDRRIRGQGSAPRTVDLPALVQLLIARLPGAISYVRADHLDPRVRAVRIDGRLPGEPGYPLTP